MAKKLTFLRACDIITLDDSANTRYVITENFIPKFSFAVLRTEAMV